MPAHHVLRAFTPSAPIIGGGVNPADIPTCNLHEAINKHQRRDAPPGHRRVLPNHRCAHAVADQDRPSSTLASTADRLDGAGEELHRELAVLRHVALAVTRANQCDDAISLD